MESDNNRRAEAVAQVVGPSGPLDATIAIVGARPGADEVHTGRGFTGPSGELLWRLLGVPRTECYVTNVCKDFNPDHPTPTKDEIHSALPALREELASCKANIIVALGAQACYALAGKEPISDWRGSILESSLLPGRKVLPSWHPAGCLRAYEQTFVLEFDLRRAVRESNYSDIRRPTRDFTIDAGLHDTLEWLAHVADPISVDIETFPGGVSCVGISDRADRAICIPFTGGCLSVTELATVWRRLDHLFRTRRIIGQNIQFDVTKLERLGFKFEELEFDTMLAHHLLWPELAHDLGFIVSMYTDEPFYKDEINADTKQGFWTYNCKDAACTFECSTGLLRELREADLLPYFTRHVMGLIRPVMRMQELGFRVAFDRLHEIRKRLELETHLLQLQLDTSLGFPCNVRSTTDLRFLLHDKLSLPRLKETKGGKPSTDEDTLRRLAYNSPYAEIFQKILDIRERRTLVSGFLNLEVDEHDSRYKANYLIHGTDSGRLSSRAARKGPQLQNVPKQARSIFVPEPGNVLIQGDLRRAEAMFVAYDAREEALIDTYNDERRDPYCEFATDTLGRRIGPEDVERDVFKRCTHAANYGMGPRKFVTVLRLAGINIEDLDIRGIHGSEAKSKYVIEAYHARHPGIRRWHSEIRSIVSHTRILHDAFGRRRTFLGRMDDSLLRAAFSFRPQATIVGITNLALQRLDGERVLTQQHDGIVVECVADDVSRCSRRLSEAMSIPITLHGRTFTIPVEIKVGESWGDMHALAA